MRLYPLHSLFNLTCLKKEKYQNVANNTKSALLLYINNTRFIKRNSFTIVDVPFHHFQSTDRNYAMFWNGIGMVCISNSSFDAPRCLILNLSLRLGSHVNIRTCNDVYCDICRHYTTPFTNLCLCARNCRRCMIIFINICYIAS